jgi:Protein of unknown function (DUF760)
MNCVLVVLQFYRLEFLSSITTTSKYDVISYCNRSHFSSNNNTAKTSSGRGFDFYNMATLVHKSQRAQMSFLAIPNRSRRCRWTMKMTLLNVIIKIACDSFFVTSFRMVPVPESSRHSRNPCRTGSILSFLDRSDVIFSYERLGNHFTPHYYRRPIQPRINYKEATSSSRQSATTRLFAGIGSNDDNRSPPPPGDGRNNDNPWSHFLNPNYKESDNLQKAREFASENSLPISYNHDVNPTNNQVTNREDPTVVASSSSMILSKKNGDDGTNAPVDTSSNGPNVPEGKILVTAEQLARNPYISVVSKLTPSEMISKFTSSAHPRVQDAVRTTVLGMIGGLPQLAFETSTITTGQALASLMFQLQMTGYMFKVREPLRIVSLVGASLVVRVKTISSVVTAIYHNFPL